MSQSTPLSLTSLQPINTAIPSNDTPTSAVAPQFPQTPNAPAFDREDFTFLPTLLQILNKMALAEGSPETADEVARIVSSIFTHSTLTLRSFAKLTQANKVATLKQKLTTAQKYVRTLPGTDAPTSDLESTLQREREILELKKQQLKKYSELPIFSKISVLSRTPPADPLAASIKVSPQPVPESRTADVDTALADPSLQSPADDGQAPMDMSQ
ncbi:hypothetical protein HK097_000587 [Rhizophlyctis rosea]|uniref:Mediator complex subunit 9 n=1 Tax=Rhizophlyctis rosea TaxID=64517 RepID=A0AAD5X1C9_9FUNG|nr:hypothetical protein HK097_000587 [Rhizophlyctis rosea]